MSTLLRTTLWHECVLVDCTRCSECFVQLFEAWTWLVCMLACLRLCVTSQLSRATLRKHTKRDEYESDRSHSWSTRDEKKEVKPLVTSRRRVWRQKNLVGKAHAYRLDVIFFFLSFRSLSWRFECSWRNVYFNFGSWPGRDRRNRSRNAAEGRCWISACAFSSEQDLDAECRVTITIPFFERRKQVPQSAWSKKKKEWCAKLKKSQKIKCPRKSNPPQYLWGCFEGVFVPDRTRLGMREGVSYQIWLDRACESEALDSSGRVARPGQIETSIRHVPEPVTGIWLVSFRRPTFS